MKLLGSAITYLVWTLDKDLRFVVLMIIALTFSTILGVKIWLPVHTSCPATFGDGEFQVSDIYYLLKYLFATFLTLVPWLLPLKAL
ncbi:MAG: hypothetical protein MJE63_03465 [Proteobacteria bacterium]|nr:hypothetical protein [Pseudomonadota bacterium]